MNEETGTIYNRYSDEFKKNVVAVVRSGIPVESVARRLCIPRTSITNWRDSARFADVGPAGDEILRSLPPDRRAPDVHGSPALEIDKDEGGFVKVPVPAPELLQSSSCGKLEESSAPSCLRLTYGRLSIELPPGFSSSDVGKIIDALGGRDAL